MKTINKCHLGAVMDVIELALIASLIALIADLGWVIHDVSSNHMSIAYGFIGGGLLIGIILTSLSLYKHHKVIVDEKRKHLLITKLKIQKDKLRYLRRMNHG